MIDLQALVDQAAVGIDPAPKPWVKRDPKQLRPPVDPEYARNWYTSLLRTTGLQDLLPEADAVLRWFYIAEDSDSFGAEVLPGVVVSPNFGRGGGLCWYTVVPRFGLLSHTLRSGTFLYLGEDHQEWGRQLDEEAWAAFVDGIAYTQAVARQYMAQVEAYLHLQKQEPLLEDEGLFDTEYIITGELTGVYVDLSTTYLARIVWQTGDQMVEVVVDRERVNDLVSSLSSPLNGPCRTHEGHFLNRVEYPALGHVLIHAKGGYQFTTQQMSEAQLTSLCNTLRGWQRWAVAWMAWSKLIDQEREAMGEMTAYFNR